MYSKKRGLICTGIVVAILALAIQGCSSSRVGEGSGSDDEAFLDEGASSEQTAQTDVVPEDGTELKTADSTSGPQPEPDNSEKKEPDPLEASQKNELDELAASSSPSPAPSPAPAEAEAPKTEKQDILAESSTPPSEPAPTPVVSHEGTGTGEQEDYKIQKTDTLMKIAFEVYGDIYRWKDIYEKNKDKIKDPNSLPVGLSLHLEKGGSQSGVDRSGERYDIKNGDTLGTIAQDIYGTPKKWKKLWEANKQLIKNPNRIYAGFYLYYSLTPEEKAEAERLKQTGTQPLAVTENTTAPPATDRAPASTPQMQPPAKAPEPTN